MIRLIAADLDDTLLGAHAILTARTRDALRAAMARGCGITLSSGRMLEAMLPIAREIGVNAPMLLYNGAWIYDLNTEQTISAQRVPFETALEITRFLERRGYYVQLYPGRGYYCDRINPLTRAYAESIRVQPIEARMPMSRWLAEQRCDLQKLLVIDTPSGADAAQSALREAFGDRASFLKSKAHYVEIAPTGVDKGSSLQCLWEHLGLAREEVMAFGDGQNDEPMIRAAGEGWAMANACPQSLAAADFVAPSNLEDGVAQVIERYLDEGKIGGMSRDDQRG